MGDDRMVFGMLKRISIRNIDGILAVIFYDYSGFLIVLFRDRVQADNLY